MTLVTAAQHGKEEGRPVLDKVKTPGGKLGRKTGEKCATFRLHLE